MNFKLILFSSILVLLLFDLDSVHAQYIENKTQLTEKGENYQIGNGNEGYSDPVNPFIRIQDETFTRQNMLTGKPVGDTGGGPLGFIYAYAGIGFLVLITGFFVVKKIRNRNKIDSRKLKKSKKRSQRKK